MFVEDGKHLDFENQARQLAGELFDHVDIETAIGIHLLARHMLACDYEKAEHFRDMASSMCKRIKGRVLDPSSRARLLRLEIVNSALRRFYQPLLGHVASDYSRMMEEAPNDSTGHLENLLPLLSFGLSFIGIFQQTDVAYANASSLSFRLVAPEEILVFSQLLEEKVSPILHRVCSPPNQARLTSCALDMVRAIILFAGTRREEALVILHQASVLLEENAHFWPYASPHLADLVHVCFVVAFSVQDYDLARTFNRLQHSFAKFFPSTTSNCLRDEVLLSTIPGSVGYTPCKPEHENPPLMNSSLDWMGDNFEDILHFPLFPN